MTRSPRPIDSPAPGMWLVRCCRRCPPVAARIYWCAHEPGLPDNPVDQAYLQGQLGLELVPPNEVWMKRGIEISTDEFLHQTRLLRWLADNRPTDPRLNFRQPVDMAAIPVPRWSTS